jgi:hypothetical protein
MNTGGSQRPSQAFQVRPKLSPYLASMEQLGRFSRKFMATVVKAMIASIKEGVHRRVDRR